jgi:uncharacterized protein YicC (UPF0701 family)
MMSWQASGKRLAGSDALRASRLLVALGMLSSSFTVSEKPAKDRAVVRLEEQLRKSRDGRDANGRNLKAVLSRVLAEMLANSINIREVLTQIEAEAGTTITAPS